MSRPLALVDSANQPRTHARAGTAPPLLETKLYVPRSRSSLVARPRLIDALRQGAGQKLTIVVAPAGFGKTTLLAGWIADAFGADSAAAWVSLDATENEPSVFWSYFITAVERL